MCPALFSTNLVDFSSPQEKNYFHKKTNDYRYKGRHQIDIIFIMMNKWRIILFTLIALAATFSAANSSTTPMGMNHLYLGVHNESQTMTTQRLIPHQPEIIPQNTFAMTMADLGDGIQAGELFPATQIGDVVSLFMPNGSIDEVSPSQVRSISVPSGTKPPITLFSHKIMLGFDDGSTGSYLQNLKEDSLSVFSPLAYQLDGTNGKISGALDHSVVVTAHERQVQVWAILASGFNPAKTTLFLQNPSAEYRFLMNMVSIVKQSGLDGVNFDFEDMEPSDAPLYTLLIQDAALLLHAMGKWVSVDVTLPSKDPNWSLIYQRTSLANASDYLVAMSYDQHYLGEQQIGSVSAIPWMESGIHSIVKKGVPGNKILLGVPFYAIDWYKTGNSWHSYYLSMFSQEKAKNSPGAHLYYSAGTGQHELVYPSSGAMQYIWLEDSLSLTQRGRYAKRTNLAGTAVWQLELGSNQDLQALIRAF